MEKALALARDVHWWVLVAAALLEENIEWLSYSITCGQSGSCQCLGSHRCLGGCRRSWLAGCWQQVPSAVSCSGDSVKRCMHLPSPTWPRWQVIFEKSSQRGTWQCRSFHHQPQPQRTCLTAASWWRETSDVHPPLTCSLRTSLEERHLHLDWKGEMAFGEN